MIPVENKKSNSWNYRLTIKVTELIADYRNPLTVSLKQFEFALNLMNPSRLDAFFSQKTKKCT